MNKIYRLVWSSTQKAWVVAGEFAGARGKGSSSLRIAKRVGGLSGFVAAALMAFPADAWVAGGGTSSAALDNNIATNTSINGGAATATGNATAIGPTASASGAASTAIGQSATATGADSIALGHSASSNIVNGIAIGPGAKASGGNGAMALGAQAAASSDGAIAFGSNSVATNTNATAIGRSSVANGYSAVAIGDMAKATPDHSTAIGGGSLVTGLEATSIGWYANTAGAQAQALGYYANAQGVSSSAVGPKASAVGDYSVALGSTAATTGNYGIAVGSAATSAANSLAVGMAAKATGTETVAIGENDATAVARSIAIGTSAGTGGVATAGAVGGDTTGNIAIGSSSGQNVKDDGVNMGGSNTAIGTSAGNNVTGRGNQAIGKGTGSTVTGNDNFATAFNAGSTVSGNWNIAQGINAGTNVTGDNNFAYGSTSGQSVTGGDNIAMGQGAGNNISTSGTVAIGWHANASQNSGVALGSGSSATTAGGVALGQSSVASRTGMSGTKEKFSNTAVASTQGAVSVGAAGAERQITNVAGGTQATDAVNVRQLQSVSDSSVHYDNNPDGTVNYNNVTLGGTTYNSTTHTGGTKITNVADGSNPSDAVNFSQLTTTNNNINNIYATGTKYFHANSTGTDSSATGADAVAIGMGSVASSSSSIAMGQGAQATNTSPLDSADSAIAIGNGANVNSTNAIALGNKALVGFLDTGSIAIGSSSTAHGVNSIAMGDHSSTIADDALAIGANSKTYNQSVAIGSGAKAGTVTTTGAVAVGYNAVASGLSTSSIGRNSQAIANYGVALGAGTIADRTGMNGAKELFSNTAVASTQGAVSVGAAGAERQITNVAGGTQATDAVNVRQLQSVSDSSVHYDNNPDGTVNYNNVTLGGTTYNSTTHTGGTKITNVADGSNPSDAVNFSQLTTTNNNINNIYATGTKNFHANSTGTDSSATGIDAVAIGMGAVADVARSVALGDGAKTELAVATTGTTIRGTDYKFAGTAPVGTVSIGSKGEERTLTNLAAGSLSATSTDGVNGSQLFATNTALSTITGDVTNLDAGSVKYDKFVDGSVNYNSITLGGDTYDNSTHTGGTKITNVADGSDPSDAVNFSQLTETNNNVTNLGDQVNNIYATGTKYFHANSTGTDSSATGTDAVAIGMGAVADVARSVALGDGAKTEAAVATTGANIAGTDYAFAGTAPVGTVSIGDAGSERTLTNLAAGSLSATSTDGINGSQLFATNSAINNLDGHAVKYETNVDGSVNYNNVIMDGDTYNSTTHTGGTKITNIADGSDPSDAVNFSQLTETNNNVTNLGDQVNNIYATGTKYFHANSTGTDSSATGTDAVAIGMGAVADVARSVALGDGSKTQEAVGTSGTTLLGVDYTFAGTAPVGTVSIGDAGSERTLTNLAAGSLSATSTDGVNGSQLFATNTALNSVTSSVTNLDAGTVHYDKYVDGTVNYNSVTMGGDTYNNTTHTGGTKITNIADGSDPSDAVNFSQLTTTNNNIDNIYNTGTKYFHANSTGTDSSATGIDAVAIGMGAVADVARSVALGDGATTLAAIGTAGTKILGVDYKFAGTAPVGTVSIGSKGEERTLTNLAAGSMSATSTDGVNGSQLFATNTALSTITGDVTNLDAGSVKYDTNIDGTVNYNSVTMGGDTYNSTTHTGGTKITNVADGTAPSDAVNFSQLTETNNNINNVYTNGTKYFHANSTGADSSATGADAVAIGQSATASAMNSIAIGNGAEASTDNSVALGNGSKTQAAVGTSGITIQGQNYAFAGTAPVGTVSVGDAGAERTITNLAAGSLSATSTDGINGSQLFATNSAINNLDGHAVKYETNVDGSVNYNNVIMGGDTYNSTTHTGGTKITNIADGSDPSDAVNFSQLTETNNNVTNLGDQVNNIYATGTKYFHANSTGTDSSATGTDAVAIGMGAVADVARSVALGDGSKTQEAVGTSGTTLLGVDYTFAGTAPVGTVSIGDAGSERT